MSPRLELARLLLPQLERQWAPAPVPDAKLTAEERGHSFKDGAIWGWLLLLSHVFPLC